MESKKINQLATELSPALDDLTIIGDPTTGISKKITLSQMASLFTGTVEEYANLAAFPLVGVADTIYIALDTNVLYRWNGSAYVELSPNIINSLVFSDANGFDGTINLVGSVATLTITTALTLGSLPFIGSSGALIQDNSNLFYDDTNNRLGIGTNAPTTPLDVFGSGIIARINGTSTNNGFLGFASAGTNKWSLGNVQSDHRFRIFSEANSAELVSLLQTGEFGIGIANPTTKFHVDGGATALIANLDANVSVAKSLSFRSDNSNRINLEVSGTESGSDAGANFFIRRYSDAGALIDTPLTITRSTGLITLATALSGTTAVFSGAVGVGISTPFTLTNYNFVNTNGVSGGGIYMSKAGVGKAVVYSANDDLYHESVGSSIFATGTILGGTPRLTIAATGESTFSKSVTINDAARIDAANGNQLILDNAGERFTQIDWYNNNSGKSVIFWDNTNNYFQIQSTPASSKIRVVAQTNGVELANGGTSWSSLSDIREKTIIRPIQDALTTLKDYRTVIGRYNTDLETVERAFLIAQDVQMTYPYAVTEDDDEDKRLRLSYTELIPLLVKSIQELKAEIDILKNTQTQGNN
jgi:hypothetical protein